MSLPGNVPPILARALDMQDEERRHALTDHILGGSSANWLADWFKRAGTPVGKTTIKDYRTSIKEAA